mmetsp:Transcript_9001/g.22183  ORF Transcript_9001/g.22183 Transcript_9001/m.22183 type:complete len:224 (+) Transcript_9001:329-1000(+)
MYRSFLIAASKATGGGSPKPAPSGALARRQSSVVEGFADLFKEDTRARMHDRLDWKLWNLFLAMLPPAALYATLVYARRDMDELIAKDKDFLSTRRSKRPPVEERGAAAAAAGSSFRGSSEEEAEQQGHDIMDKLEAMDTKMRELDERLKSSSEANALLRKQVAALQSRGPKGEAKGEEGASAPKALRNGGATAGWLNWRRWRRRPAPDNQGQGTEAAESATS